MPGAGTALGAAAGTRAEKERGEKAKKVERAASDVRLLRRRVRLVLPAQVVTLELDRRVAHAE